MYVSTLQHTWICMHLQCTNNSSVLPRIFLRRLAIAGYYTNSKPSQSNGYTMLLLQSNSNPNMHCMRAQEYVYACINTLCIHTCVQVTTYIQVLHSMYVYTYVQIIVIIVHHVYIIHLLHTYILTYVCLPVHMYSMNYLQ